MVILVDTNIILDVLQKREPFYTDSKDILTKCASGDINGYILKYDTLQKMINIINHQENISAEYDNLTNSIYVNHIDTGVTYAIPLKKYKVEK